MTVCRIIKEVTGAILTELKDNMGWPESEADRRRMAGDFMKMAGVPMVCGCVDGTLINLTVAKDNLNAFRDRYGATSINCLIVADSTMRILYASPKFPGGCHDARVFRRTIGTNIPIIRG